MLLDLDAPILTYFEATNAHQADAVAALFTSDALVHDEAADHRGREAIRDWAEGTYRKYGVALMPLGAESDGEATVVTAEVSGTFPGSPIRLPFRFVTDGDLISELRIPNQLQHSLLSTGLRPHVAGVPCLTHLRLMLLVRSSQRLA